MKSALPLLLLLSAVASSSQAEIPLLANVSGRTNISLNGSWRIIVDPYETGLDAHYWENKQPQDKSALVEYNFDASETLTVPGDWNTQKEKLFFYEGAIWYEKSFSYQRKAHIRTYVYFGAANYLSRVYLNGQKLGEHEGGFTPFNFEITDKLRDGANFLVVEVSNTRLKNGVPSLKTDWWNYGGLTREVRLVEVPDVFIQNYSVQLAKNSQDEVAGWLQLNGASQSQQVTLEIPQAGIKKTITTTAEGRGEFRIQAKLQLWSPGNPKLYDVTLTAGDDTVRDKIGFRSIEARGTQIILNGKPIFLRGISLHEEAPFRSGRAFSEEDAEMLLQWVKDLGCNFVRFAHYPHNENELRVADRLGLLVWSEIPVYWDISWTEATALANGKSQLREMIARDHNRASVIFWSLSNETPIKPERLNFLKQLVGVARTDDATRLITSAMNHTDKVDQNTRVLNDPLGEYLDVLGLNEYVGWYEGLPADADRIEWKSAYNKPLIISEFGGDALYGNHGDKDARWTEEYQANLFEHQIKMLQRIPGLAGMSPWLLMDFHSPRRPLPGIQDYYNRKGLISHRGERKQAFYVLQRFYHELSARMDAAQSR